MTHNTIDFPAKHPSSILDYLFDWSDWLPTGDAIASVEWALSPADGLTQVDTAFTDTTATIWLSGGVSGASVLVSCTITTANDPARVEVAYGRIQVRA